MNNPSEFADPSTMTSREQQIYLILRRELQLTSQDFMWLEIDQRGWIEIGLRSDLSAAKLERAIITALKPEQLIAQYPANVTANGRTKWLACLRITTLGWPKSPTS